MTLLEDREREIFGYNSCCSGQRRRRPLLRRHREREEEPAAAPAVSGTRSKLQQPGGMSRRKQARPSRATLEDELLLLQAGAGGLRIGPRLLGSAAAAADDATDAAADARKSLATRHDLDFGFP